MSIRTLLACLMFCLLSNEALSNPALSTDSSSEITLTAWNIEHLAEANNSGCKPRSNADYDALKDFAATLDADVIAFQEVESQAAVERVLPAEDWHIIVSPRPANEPYECGRSGSMSTQQRVAFAIRKGIEFDYDPNKTLSTLGLDRDSLRYGLAVTITESAQAIDVLNVHLKSRCFVNDFSASDTEHCNILSRQLPVLEAWIDQREAEQSPYVILGDFNHRYTYPGNQFWQELTTSNNQRNRLDNLMQGVAGCHPRYPTPIDHILAGGGLAGSYVDGSIEVHHFGKQPGSMSEDDMLSDHCPISASFALKTQEPAEDSASESQQFEIDRAIRWAQESAEYRLITQALYHQATQQQVPKMQQIEGPWVVYMDVDETLLDNSAYQYDRNSKGLKFTYDTWNAWVAREQAHEVPGSKAFVEAVLAAGGQIALITNRDRATDPHTWNNLQALGYPMTRENTCLLGRADEDKTSIDGKNIINDKDLRRIQVAEGSARDCWKYDDALKKHWQKELTVAMEVGDNIQDFARVKQKTADVESMVELQGHTILVLPNAMYGSWSY